MRDPKPKRPRTTPREVISLRLHPDLILAGKMLAEQLTIEQNGPIFLAQLVEIGLLEVFKHYGVKIGDETLNEL